MASVERPGGTDTYGYDASGSQTSRTEAGEAYTQTVNGEGQLAGVQNTTSGDTWTFAYDGDPTPLRFGDIVGDRLRHREASRRSPGRPSPGGGRATSSALWLRTGQPCWLRCGRP